MSEQQEKYVNWFKNEQLIDTPAIIESEESILYAANEYIRDQTCLFSYILTLGKPNTPFLC